MSRLPLLLCSSWSACGRVVLGLKSGCGRVEVGVWSGSGQDMRFAFSRGPHTQTSSRPAYASVAEPSVGGMDWIAFDVFLSILWTPTQSPRTAQSGDAVKHRIMHIVKVGKVEVGGGLGKRHALDHQV